MTQATQQMFVVKRNGRAVTFGDLRTVDRWIDHNSMLIPDVDYSVEPISDREAFRLQEVARGNDSACEW